MQDDNKFPYFFLGLGLGVAVGLLFAPKSGSETRELLLNKADEGKEYLKRQSAQLRNSAGDAIERGKSALARQREQLSAAVEAGRQAYREAVDKELPGDGAPAGDNI
ncbi:MAG TPA: YtxH domain-containing protein [Bryobacteraceae bacterium]|nr:YtxH domain-containing protein [Bryobacteraceae bacterium]